MTYRNINVDGTVYEYVVGKQYVKIKGVGLFSKQEVGHVINEDNVMVQPSHIREMILYGKRLPLAVKICTEHKLQEILVADPFDCEIHDRKIYRWMCKKCYAERAMDI